MTRLPFREVPDHDAEEASFVVCQRDEPNVPCLPLAQRFGSCAWCLSPIYWAATAPAKPLKVCVPCFEERLRRGEIPSDELEIITTARQRRQVEEFL